jgi:hypothetical protein
MALATGKSGQLRTARAPAARTTAACCAGPSPAGVLGSAETTAVDNGATS